MSLFLNDYWQWVVQNFEQIKQTQDFAAMGAQLLMSGVGLPNAEALGETVNALIKIFSMVNDRIWALHKRALSVYPTDGLRMGISALAKLSLSLEMFASEAGRSKTVLMVETVRLILRFTLLVRRGFDVLVHGGEPDQLVVQLQRPAVPGMPESAAETPQASSVPTLNIIGGHAADTSKRRSLWWRGAGTGDWYNMPSNHAGAVAGTCRQAHLPVVWQVVVSETLLVTRPFVEAFLRHVKPGRGYWLSTLAAFLMDGASVQLLSQAQAKYGEATSSAEVVKAEIWRRKLAFRSFLFREPFFSLIIGRFVRKIQAGFDYIPLLRKIVRWIVSILFYWQRFFYWSVPP